MQSELLLACTTARGSIIVPEVPMAALRTAAARSQPMAIDPRRQRFVAAAAAAASIVAVAAAAEIYSTTHVWFDRSGAMELTTDRAAFVDHPTETALAAAARRVDFPIVLPTGLPEHTPLTLMASASNALILRYDLPGASRRSNHLLWVILANQKTIGDAPATKPKAFVFRLGGQAMRGGDHWAIGREEVIVPESSLTAAEESQMRRAMTLRADSSP